MASRAPGGAWQTLSLAFGAEQLRQQLREAGALVGIGIVQRLLRAVQEFRGQTSNASLCENGGKRLHLLFSREHRAANEIRQVCAFGHQAGEAGEVSGNLIGCALFLRHSRGLDVTPAGRIFMRRGLAMLQEMESLGAELQDLQQGVVRHVRLFAGTAAIHQFLPPLLAAYAEQHPEVQIDLEEQVSEQVVLALRDGRADVGVFVQGPNTEGLEVRDFRQDELVLIVPRGHRLDQATPVAFADTLGEPWISLNPGAALLQQQQSAAMAAGRPLKLRMQVASLDAVAHMVAAGLGIGMLPRAAARPRSSSICSSFCGDCSDSATSTAPSPPANDADASSRPSSASPSTASPSTIRSAASRPMLTDTGNSGSAKVPASAEGPLSPASGIRSSTIRWAESSDTSTTPRNSADRDQSSTTPSSVIHTPASSAIVNRWIDARMARQYDMPEGPYVSLCVTDNGPGIDGEQRDTLLTRWAQGQDSESLGQGHRSEFRCHGRIHPACWRHLHTVSGRRGDLLAGEFCVATQAKVMGTHSW